VIRKDKSGKGYVLMSKDGTKVLGRGPTRAAMEKREKQVQYFKARAAGKIKGK